MNSPNTWEYKSTKEAKKHSSFIEVLAQAVRNRYESEKYRIRIKYMHSTHIICESRIAVREREREQDQKKETRTEKETHRQMERQQ